MATYKLDQHLIHSALYHFVRDRIDADAIPSPKAESTMFVYMENGELHATITFTEPGEGGTSSTLQ